MPRPMMRAWMSWVPEENSSLREQTETMLTFVGVDGLEVHDVPDDVVLVADTVAAQHVPALSGNGEGLPTVVTLQN